MSGNSFGKLFTLTTAGESHGDALLGIVDGCPPGMKLSEEDLQGDLDLRKPGSSRHTTQRRESDAVKIVSGTFNGLTTLGGMPVALFLLVTSIQPAIIRGSLAALFFLTDIYAFTLSFFAGIVDWTTIYRTIPLIIILPIGVFIGNKFFVKSKEETYRKVVFYFLIVISIFGILRITNIL